MWSIIDVTSRITTSNVSSVTGRFGPINNNDGGRASTESICRSTARNLRRSRFRATAGPDVRLIANAADVAWE